MTTFDLHTTQTAPAASQPVLEGAQKALGFVPNLYAVLAESPAALEAYTTLSKILDGGSFDATERQVVLMTANAYHECRYCQAAHTTISQMTGVPEDVVTALRDGTPLPNPKLQALADFTRTVLEKRGWVDGAELEAFLGAGYSKAQLLEVITGLALKTMSNYTNHIVETPVDEAFAPNSWSPPAAV